MTLPPDLNYLTQHPAAARLTCARPWVLLLGFAILLFWRHVPPRRRLVSGLRTAAFLLLVMVLADLRVTARLPDRRLALVAAVDVSDSVGEEGRLWAMEHLRRLSRTLAPEDQLAIVTFAGTSVVDTPPGPPGEVAGLRLPAGTGATDIAQALETAAALFPADGDRRLLLVSDGVETRGDSRLQIPALRAAGIRTDTVIPVRPRRAAIRIEKLSVPATAAQGRVFPIRVVTDNGGACVAARFALHVDGRLVDSRTVVVAPGVDAVEVPYQLDEPGNHRLRVTLDCPGDPSAGSAGREAPIMVGPRKRVLLVARRPGSVIAQVLRQRGFVVEQRAPSAFPETPAELTPFHAVVLETPQGADLHPPALRALERYVSEFGGGLVVAGGTSTFGDERFRKTPLERMLPVTIEPRRPNRPTREPLALEILIDRSNSMGYNSRIRALRDGEKLRYAKEAARTVLHQLKDEDFAGVIAFDAEAHTIAPLRPLLENRDQLERDLPRLVEFGGTDFYDALTLASDELLRSRVNRRHVILLTDGDTNRAAEEHYPLIRRLAEAQISVTTIRIGDDRVNLRLLQDISERTGGQFHHVEGAEALPDLMLKDTVQALGSQRPNEEFLTAFAVGSEILNEIPESSLPLLGGYAYSRAKPNAEVVLIVPRLDRRDPLLTVWNVGAGRVAAFTANPAEDAERWPAWDNFGKFWSQLLHWTSAVETADAYLVEAQREDGQIQLRVRTFGPDTEGGLLLARLEAPGGVRELTLVPEGPRIFRAQIPGLGGGRFPLTLTRRNGIRDVTEQTLMVTFPDEETPSPEEDPQARPNFALLAQIAAETGGHVDPAPQELAQRTPGKRSRDYPLDWILVPLAMFAFVTDLAVRRFSPALDA